MHRSTEEELGIIHAPYLGWSRVHVKTWLKKYVKVAGIAEFDRQSARKPLIFEMGGPGGLKLKFICQDPHELIPK